MPEISVGVSSESKQLFKALSCALRNTLEALSKELEVFEDDSLIKII